MRRRPAAFIILILVMLAFVPATFASTPLLEQGIADYKDESYEEALDNLTKARSEDPKSAEAAYYLGLTYNRLQDFKNAKTQLKDALALDPGLKDGYFVLAEVLYNLGELDEALSRLDEAEKQGGRPGEIYFLRGLVLLKAGKNANAVESFKKAKEADKSLSQAADYQIAMAYIKENRLKEAREVFNEVVVRDPSTDLALYADEYSKVLEKREEREKPLKIKLGLRYEYDDNVILKPADSAVATGVTGQVDRREVFTFRGEYTKRFSNPWSLRTEYSFYLANQHHLKSYNIQSHAVSVTPSYNFKDSTASVGLSYNNTLVHDREYLQTAALTPSYNFMIGASTVGALSARLQKREFMQAPFSKEEDRDSVETALGAGLFRFFAGDEGFVALRYEINRDSTEGINWAYIGNKAALSVLYPVSERIKVQAYADAFLQNFENENTFFLKRRRDKVYSQSVLISYGFYKGADFVLQYTHVRDDSNIAIYDYERNIVSGGLEFRL